MHGRHITGASPGKRDRCVKPGPLVFGFPARSGAYVGSARLGAQFLDALGAMRLDDGRGATDTGRCKTRHVLLAFGGPSAATEDILTTGAKAGI